MSTPDTTAANAKKPLTERERLEEELRSLETENDEAFGAARREREEIAELRAKVERAANAKRDAPAIADAEEKHGEIGKKIAVVETSLGAVIVKRPPAMIFKRFQDRGEMKTQYLEELVRPCLLYPEKDRFNQILDEQPATLVEMANACSALAGVKSKEQAGKS